MREAVDGKGNYGTGNNVKCGKKSNYSGAAKDVCARWLQGSSL